MEKENSVKEGYVEKERNREKAKDGNGREKEREIKTSKLIYLNEATSGRRLWATHGGNPYTRVPVRGGGTRIRSNTRILYACKTTEHNALSRSYGGDREHAHEREVR